jgi:NAD(P)-dependent dehydrogenase (short-subunit alcohol dehydrogenase family)
VLKPTRLAAIICLSKVLATQPGKVRVTIIYPGAVESELVEASNDEETPAKLGAVLAIFHHLPLVERYAMRSSNQMK